MSVKEAKAIYESLLDNGELGLMFPEASGDWKLDKEKFIEAYNKNLEMLYSDLEAFEDDDYYEEI